MDFESQEEPAQEQDQKQQVRFFVNFTLGYREMLIKTKKKNELYIEITCSRVASTARKHANMNFALIASQLRKDVSEAFVASLAEMLMTQMQTMATDLEAFAIHGKRATITMEDVKLCSRRNDSLYQLISDAANDISKESNGRKKK
ncbi:hypothetical protein [Parasitella parasitica]|uniref:Centromere protein S n=1 Tax=Parasitella parasitica TaxID=35722 RepID=A0A0B7NUV0_9FUNG|nr:hypothetical protein [Parasitella parasitica]